MDDVAFATLKWVWWFNYHRILEPIGHVPPAEYEEAVYRAQEGPSKRRDSRKPVSDELRAVQSSPTADPGGWSCGGLRPCSLVSARATAPLVGSWALRLSSSRDTSKVFPRPS
jgi:hypothetical protein